MFRERPLVARDRPRRLPIMSDMEAQLAEWHKPSKRVPAHESCEKAWRKPNRPTLDEAGHWKTPVIYLSGPMTGIPLSNYPAFQAAAADLRRQGYTVISPAELDAEQGIDPQADMTPEVYAQVLLKDLEEVRKADEVWTLAGWRRSRGAKTEVAYARALGKPVLPYRRSDETPRRTDETPSQFDKVEVRVVNERTGGAKGRKAERFELLPWEAIGEVAKVYAFGAGKYDDHNWRKGYDWSLSFGAMQRHLAAFWDGEDNDPESGLPHVAHAGFHCLSLLTFMREHGTLDDRFKGEAR